VQHGNHDDAAQGGRNRVLQRLECDVLRAVQSRRAGQRDQLHDDRDQAPGDRGGGCLAEHGPDRIGLSGATGQHRAVPVLAGAEQQTEEQSDATDQPARSPYQVSERVRRERGLARLADQRRGKHQTGDHKRGQD
jgi:hypothetical protein